MTVERLYVPSTSSALYCSHDVAQVYDRDPVRTQSLAAYVGAYLRQAEAVCGPQAFQMTYLSKADPAVLKQIQDELARA